MKRKLFFLSALLVLLSSSTALAQEAKFKALFTFKFAEYVEWSDGNSQTTIGVVGNSPVFDELSTFAAAKPNIDVIKISGAADASKCRIVFLPEGESGKASAIASSIGGQSILLVAEKKDLAGNGADIGFYTEGGKLRFVISEKDIRRKKMTPSGKLLALGKSI